MDVNLTPFSRAIKREIDRRRGSDRRGYPRQEEIAEAIGRTQPYVSSRITGKLPWTADDLERMAPLFGETAFTLIASAYDRQALESHPIDLRTRTRRDVGTASDTDSAVARERTPDRGEE